MNYARARFLGSEGFCINRPNMGKSFVFERPVAHIDAATIPAIKSIPEEARKAISALAGEETVMFRSHLCFLEVKEIGKTTKFTVDNAWTPSKEDEEADDWQVFEVR
jgi:hypothetical protein